MPQIDLDDDAPVGRVLTRREVLVLFGAAAGGMAVAACAPAAVSSPSASSTAATPGSPAASGSAVASSGGRIRTRRLCRPASSARS